MPGGRGWAQSGIACGRGAVPAQILFGWHGWRGLAVGVRAREPGQAGARWGRRGRAAASDFQADDYFMESSEVQSYVCLLSAVTLSLFNVVLTAACFYKSK